MCRAEVREETWRDLPGALGIAEFDDGDGFFVDADDGAEMGVALVVECHLIPGIERLLGLTGGACGQSFLDFGHEGPEGV